MSEPHTLTFGLEDVSAGEFAGWRVCQADPFEQRAGPFYEAVDAEGRALIAFRGEPRHMNGAGFMHGGCVLTFADSALFTIAREAMGGSHGVTMTLGGDFLDAVRVGQLVEARRGYAGGRQDRVRARSRNRRRGTCAQFQWHYPQGFGALSVRQRGRVRI